ncbi:MAG: hypothetical protein AAF191_01900 [Verrucomicrobiota bacterium]
MPFPRFVALCLFFSLATGSLWAVEGSSWEPASINDSELAVLQDSSPFTRSLNLSDSLLLTGIARIEEDIVATLIDKTTKETYVVSSKPNAQGWKMVEVDGGAEALDRVTAKISVGGGEVVAVRFDENQLKPGEGRPAAANGKGREKGDGKGKGGDDRRGPPQDVREKFGKLSEEQRQKIFQKMGEMRAKNPDMGRDEMREKMRGMLDKAVEQSGN